MEPASLFFMLIFFFLVIALLTPLGIMAWIEAIKTIRGRS